ncbi:ATP-NAD/AcoX kinase [Desulfomicrobium baculatum DSM 4028]|uniref:NAD kinase n=1 Tax=Desulfomicrobium baculatum (strain DSM 4028 / VKM B-1378 / X) TaxID=525897 RepID=C7LR45_DESBD|nr:ATP-NAD/AcoX kinase [Desulfomicrobium baculatum DSM 4028]
MGKIISNIVIVHNVENELAANMAQQIRRWLVGEGRTARIVVSSKEKVHCVSTWGSADMILTLGGDGTLLAVARAVQDLGIPILGLNLGKVGFLTELSPTDWRETLTLILRGEYDMSRRLVISFHVLRRGQEYYRGYAINDLVISCGSLARMIRLDMWYGTDHLGTVRADGMIVATPTGSSGYSISAGGPLIYPELNVFALTPICPFLHAFRPMVLPFENALRILVLDADPDVYLTQDGQTGVVLAAGDNIFASRAEKRLNLIRPLHSQYADKLKSKGFVRES